MSAKTPPHKKQGFRFVLLAGLLLSLLAALLSALLVCKHSGLCLSSFGCTIDGIDGCAELADSTYSRIHIPFTQKGIAIAWFGFFYYSLVALFFGRLYLNRNKQSEPALGLLSGIVVFGFIFDLFLAYRNFFTLITPCLLCLYTYLCQAGLLFSACWLYFSHSSPVGKPSKNAWERLWLEVKASRWSWAGAFALTLLLFITLSFASNGKENAQLRQSNNLLPLSMEKVPKVLRELRSLKKREVATQGLSSYIGNEEAYITIHEWLDFRCPHCRHGSDLLKAMMRRWPGRIKVYLRYFPLDASCNPHIKRRQPDSASCKAVRAAFCASKNRYYREFASKLFLFQITQTRISYTSLRELIEELGGDWPQLRSCMASGSARKAIARDIQEAKRIEITATPTILLNGYQLPAGVPEKSWLMRTIDALVLEKEGKTALRDYQSRVSK